MLEFDPFRGVAVFLQVVESGSFTIAADRLGMTKSGVAKSISRLEATLGVRLFNRTTRRLSLTDEGIAYAEGCSKARGEMEAVQHRLSTHQEQPVGKLRVNLPVVFGRRWVLPALFEIADAYPALELDISLTDRPADLLEERYDLAIRIGPLEDSTVLVAKPLGVQRAVLCAHPDYLKKHGRPRVVEDLKHHQCITFGGGTQARTWYFIDEAGHRHPFYAQGRVGINHSEAILDAALNGEGIALLADWLVSETLQEKRLVEVLPDVGKEGFPIHALWPQSNQLSRKVRVVVDLLAERFLPQAPWEWNESSVNFSPKNG
jgi:DNA-binding transcriptional LysR family regulator